MEYEARTRLLVISPAPAVESVTDAGGKPVDGSAADFASSEPIERPPKFRTAWELSKSLSGPYDVILAVPEKTLLSHPDFAVVYYNRRNIGLLANDSEAVICNADVIEAYPYLVEEVSPLLAGLHELKTVGPDAIIDSLAGRRGEPAGSGAGELMYVWRSPAAEHGKGIRYYAKRLRLHLKRGGAREAATKGGSLIKRKITGKEQS